jgi:hypothetical protein
MKKVLFLLCAAAALAGCEKSRVVCCEQPSGYSIFTRSYVTAYNHLSSLHLYEYWYDPPRVEVDGEWLPIGVKGINVHGGGYSLITSYDDEDSKKERYDALCEKHNDMTFNREVYIYPGGYAPGSFGVDFTSIDIVSNADFDAGHLAGSSLGDIVMFDGRSYKQYIDSGYDDTLLDDCRIWELVSELTPAQLTLLEYQDGPTLWIQTAPTLSKTHMFTVTMTADDGRVFSDTIEMTFE